MTQPPPPAGYLPVSHWSYWEVVVVFLSGALASLFVAAGVVVVGADPLEPIPFSIVFGSQAMASFAMAWYLSKTRGSGSLAADTGLVIEYCHNLSAPKQKNMVVFYSEIGFQKKTWCHYKSYHRMVQ